VRARAGAAWLACAALACAAPPASGAIGVKVPVVRCHTSFGIKTRLPTPPATLRVDLPPRFAAPLEAYSNGYLTALAPRGWHCAAQVGADGSGSLFVTPAPEGKNLSQPAVTVQFADTPGVSASIACALFPSARSALPVQPCPVHRPTREIIAVASPMSVAFQDPARVHGDGEPSGGSDPANGVAIFVPSSSGADGYALIETCTLPQGNHATCTSILDNVYGQGR
jgi:hypothetical protein